MAALGGGGVPWGRGVKERKPQHTPAGKKLSHPFLPQRLLLRGKKEEGRLKEGKGKRMGGKERKRERWKDGKQGL